MNFQNEKENWVKAEGAMKNYSFTVTVPPFKRIVWENQYVVYKDLTNEQQKDFIKSIVGSACDDIIEHYEIIFETHKDSRIHAHGTLYAVTPYNLEIFIDSVGTLVGVRTPKQKHTLCYCIPILSSYAEYCWNNYIQKDQKVDAQANEGDTRDYSKYLFGKLKK